MVASPTTAVVAPVAEDPTDAVLVVDPPPRAEPLPSATEFLRVMPDSLQYAAGYVGGITEKTRSLNCVSAGPSELSYLTGILTSKVYDVAIESPLELAPKVSERLGVQMLLKREDMQPVGFLASVTIMLFLLKRIKFNLPPFWKASVGGGGVGASGLRVTKFEK